MNFTPNSTGAPIKATLTNVRTGGRAVNQHFVFGKFNDAGDYYWGTELDHPRR